MSNQSKFVKFLSSKGFYIALAVCIIGTGAAAWVAIDSTMNSISAQDEKKIQNPPPAQSAAPSTIEHDWGFDGLNSPDTKTREAETKQDDVLVEKKAESSSSQSERSASSKSSSSQAASSAAGNQSKTPPTSPAMQEMAFTLPILSEVFNPYSDGSLVKSKTLGDWRTHDGIDIKASRGTQVMSCADGKVLKVYDDPLWGVSVEIEHKNGLSSVYSGLAKTSVTLKEGDTVKVKDVLGTVDRVPCEISLQSHLHFGVKEAGAWVNPVKALGLD